MAVADFAESHLGTMEYWEGVYRRELAVFQESDDVGEIWFGAQCLRRVLERVESLIGLEERATAKVLDVGTGNGHTLIKLEKKLGFAGVLVGTDYAPAAVEFAQKVAVSAGCTCVQFVTDDILDSSLISTHAHSFDLVLDKGTFDAISLRGDAQEARQNYIDTIIALLVPTTGRFLITSCNWTHDELLAQYLPAGFVYEGKIDYPTFSFGGGKGSTVASIIFTRPALSKTPRTLRYLQNQPHWTEFDGVLSVLRRATLENKKLWFGVSIYIYIPMPQKMERDNAGGQRRLWGC